MVRLVEAEVLRLEAIRAQVQALTGEKPQKKRMLSEQGRRRIVEAQHRRWASQKALRSAADGGQHSAAGELEVPAREAGIDRVDRALVQGG